MADSFAQLLEKNPQEARGCSPGGAYTVGGTLGKTRPLGIVGDCRGQPGATRVISHDEGMICLEVSDLGLASTGGRSARTICCYEFWIEEESAGKMKKDEEVKKAVYVY